MKDLVEQALELQTLLAQQGWEFCFIGGRTKVFPAQLLLKPLVSMDDALAALHA